MSHAKPNPEEPIRAYETQAGWRYRVVLDIGSPGGKRQQITKSGFTELGRKTRPQKGSARAYVNEVREGLASGDWAPPSDRTVGELLDVWLTAREADVLSGDLRPVTLDGYRAAAKTVNRHLGARRVSDLRHSDVETFKGWALAAGNRHGKPLKNDAVCLALGVLTRALDVAVADGAIRSNPAARVKRPTRRKHEEKPHWTPAQMATFREYADTLPLVLAVAMRLILCGMRRSEVCGLAWGAVSLTDGTVEVRQGRVAMAAGEPYIGEPKSTASRRRVYVETLQPGTVAMLRRLKMESANTGADALVLTHGDAPIRPELVSDTFQRAREAVVLPEINMHAIRHSIATELAKDPALADIDAAAMLGHTLAVFQQTYAQRTGDATQRAAEQWAARRAAEATGASL